MQRAELKAASSDLCIYIYTSIDLFETKNESATFEMS